MFAEQSASPTTKNDWEQKRLQSLEAALDAILKERSVVTLKVKCIRKCLHECQLKKGMNISNAGNVSI